jgi:DnaJ homolog subfamily A member 2
MSTYYEKLGVSPDATQEEITRAFRVKAKEYHPDLNPGKEELFKEANEAHEVLSNPQKRQIYDQFGEEGLKSGGGGGFGGGFGDIFEMFSGQSQRRQRGPQKGESVRRALGVSLEDLYNGLEKKIKITRTKNCGECEGKGTKDESKIKSCAKCKGQGIVMGYQEIGPGFVQKVQTYCPDCKGDGKSIEKKYKCKQCKGDKFSPEEKILNIYVDKGMKEGQKIVFDGEADERPGILPGDIVFILQQKPHDVFQRDGNHLIMKKKISLSEALTGLTFKFKHLDGRTIVASSKEGSVIKPEHVLEIKGEGMPKWKSPFDKGNLLIQFEVEFPKKIPTQMKEKLEEILPKKQKIQVTEDDYDVTLVEPVFEEEQKKHREAYDEDDEDDHQGQGISCGTQ